MALEIALIGRIPKHQQYHPAPCVIGAKLHLVSKLGYSLEDRLLKRAGLDSGIS